MLGKHVVHCCPDCLDLGDVRSNHTDRVICLGGREGEEKRGDDGTDGGGLGWVGVGIALTFAFSLDVKIQQNELIDLFIIMLNRIK